MNLSKKNGLSNIDLKSIKINQTKIDMTTNRKFPPFTYSINNLKKILIKFNLSLKI